MRFKSTSILAGVMSTLLLAATGAQAHTTVRDQMTEGKSGDTALKIGHGCTTAGGIKRGVIAQSVTWANVNPVITASDSSTISALSEVITQGSLLGLIKPIQSNDVFAKQGVKVNANSNIIAFHGRDGVLPPTFLGRVPVQVSSVNFDQTSCAKKLLVQVAIADICVATAPTLVEGKVNLWIPNNGSSYATIGTSRNIDGVGAPATLTINRDLVANPLDQACGAGIDVTVTPTAAEVDANLSIPLFWR